MSGSSEAVDEGGELSAEDAKLVTLARSARARAGAAEGAAVRDDIGRTYAAATVTLSSLRLSAVQAAVAAALSSGSSALDAVCVVSEADDVDPADRAVLAELAVGAVILVAPGGGVRAGHPPAGG